MIVCSCNVFSDRQIRFTLAKAIQRPRMSQIYDDLGSDAQCGRCAHTIKRIMEEMSPIHGAKNSACKKALPATLNASDDAYQAAFNRNPVSRSCLPAGRS